MIRQMPPLLADACARHGIAAAALAGLEWSDDGVLTAVRGDGPVIETLEQLRSLAGRPRRWQPLVIAASPMTARERAVDDLVRRGYTTAAIAAELGISARTVTATRAQLRSQAAATGLRDESTVCVVGRPSLLRDLVHDCLVAADVGAATTPGYRPAAAVVVAVRPGTRDFDVRPGVRIVVCGDLPGALGFVGAARRGLVAVLPAQPVPDELTEAVLRAAKGAVTMPGTAVQGLVDELYVERSHSAALSGRDRDMLNAIRRGESMKQTARRLGISPKTVENLRRQLFQKLGARSASEALALADPNGYSEPDPAG